jgi:DNA (cytosine-5)-methyltransferase 1
MINQHLTVLDLFAGAGGFSEGFRQMGFEITYATDNWNPALKTHEVNFPGTKVIKDDVRELDPEQFKGVDVIIGGPPCTQFSGSNRGGKGNTDKGLELVYRFLRFVHELRPRWWLMENVPRLEYFLPDSIPLRKLGVNKVGRFKIPRMKVLCAADYGTPQKRNRLLSGKYVLPQQTHWEDLGMSPLPGLERNRWVTMRHVLSTLPDPLRGSSEATVKDPNYELQVPAKELTDHFMDSTMTVAEAERNKKQKVAHPYYGKMKFPDDLDRPARTVMATQFNASRETMVIEAKKGGKTVYRKPTIRECACFQAFPLTFQFSGGNESTKYKLVGNAVPVKLAVALAKAILKEEGLPIPKAPILR